MSESVRQSIYRLVEVLAKSKVGKNRGKVSDRLVEGVTKREIPERGWEVISR